MSAVRAALAEMVHLMMTGEEPGAGSPWYLRAVAALSAAPAPATPAVSVDMFQTFDWGRDGMVPADDPNSAYCYTRDAVAHTARAVAAAYAAGKAEGHMLGFDVAIKYKAAAPQQHAQAALSDADYLAQWEITRDRGGYSSMMFVTDAAIIAFARAILDSSHQPAAAPAVADAEWPAGEREAWRLGRAAGIEEAAKVAEAPGGAVSVRASAAAIRALAAPAQPEVKP